jgi:hypothetical protein
MAQPTPIPPKVLHLLLLRTQGLSLEAAVVQTGGGWLIKNIATTGHIYCLDEVSLKVVNWSTGGVRQASLFSRKRRTDKKNYLYARFSEDMKPMQMYLGPASQE